MKKDEEEQKEMWKRKREHEEQWEGTREKRVCSTFFPNLTSFCKPLKLKSLNCYFLEYMLVQFSNIYLRVTTSDRSKFFD